MIDGGLVVGYLTAALVRGGQRWVDRTVDSLLDRLAGLVTRRLGDAPVERLKANPGDEAVQREVSLTIDGALSANQAFAREIARLVAELDEKGGRELINQVYAQINVQAFDHGIAVGRDFNYFNSPDPSDLSGAPPWVKFCIVLGAVICMTGLFIFGATLFTNVPSLDDPNFGEIPSGIPLAFGVFFLGFIILAIGSLGRAISRRR
jgi:hypothetical protein